MREFIPFAEYNKYSFPLSILPPSAFPRPSFTLSLALSIRILMHDSLIAVAGERPRGRIPSANYNSRQALCKNHEHFHSISRLPSALLRNSSDKVCAALRTPRIRAADTFICSATNTSHLYKAPIYLARGGGGLFAQTHMHTGLHRRKNLHRAYASAPFTMPDSRIYLADIPVFHYICNHICPESPES